MWYHLRFERPRFLADHPCPGNARLRALRSTQIGAASFAPRLTRSTVHPLPRWSSTSQGEASGRFVQDLGLPLIHPPHPLPSTSFNTCALSASSATTRLSGGSPPPTRAAASSRGSAGRHASFASGRPFSPEVPWRRITSPLFAVRSASYRIATICSSVNRLFRIFSPPRRAAASGTVNLRMDL